MVCHAIPQLLHAVSEGLQRLVDDAMAVDAAAAALVMVL